MVLHVQKVAGISGSEKYLLGLIPRLRARGWDARMLVLHERPDESAEFRSQLTAAGVPVATMRLRHDVDPLALVQLIKHLVALQPAVVHTHLVHADFHGLAAAFAARVPVRISTKHGFDDFRAGRVFAFADRAVARLAQRNVAVSAGLAEYLSEVEGFDPRRFEVIHYGIDVREEPPPSPEPDRLLVLGRLIPIKGHEVLLRAFAQARERVPQLTLDVVGAGNADFELHALTDGLNLNGSVAFAGNKSEVDPWLERASFVVVPSLGEGFGRVALEAMERGRAVIASRVGGLAEVVADGDTGLLVPPGEAEPLADAIVRLARDPDEARRMGTAGRTRAESRFSEERCAEQTDALYRACLSEH